MTRFWHLQLGQRNGLLEDHTIERLALASRQRSERKGGAHTTASTRRHVARVGDAMMLGGRRIGGGIVVRRNRRVDGSTTGNSPAMTRGRRAREGNLGGRGIRWVGPAHQRWQSGNGRQAGLACEDESGHCRSKPARRKTAREAFFFFEFLSHLNFHL
jgi:hypothetical protein